MVKIKLTQLEAEIVLDALDEHYLCRSGCYCEYPKAICNKVDSNGNYKCRLQRAIHNISQQINKNIKGAE